MELLSKTLTKTPLESAPNSGQAKNMDSNGSDIIQENTKDVRAKKKFQTNLAKFTEFC
jgi:hypothetical protein